jgi:DNA-binding NtrC family response regulator
MRTPGRSVRVLVVDDECSVADTLALILNRSGHESIAVYSASEAVVVAANFKPQALLSDVLMPGMNGIELAHYFTENFTDCKLLLMTGQASASDLAESFVPHGLLPNILTKPVLPQTVLAFVARCAEGLSARA